MGPHRIVTDGLQGLADGAQGLIKSVADGAKSAGESLMRGLDQPVQQVAGVQGPHRIAHRLADAAIKAFANFAVDGVIGSAKIGIEGVASAADQPLEQMNRGGAARFKFPFGGR